MDVFEATIREIRRFIEDRREQERQFEVYGLPPSVSLPKEPALSSTRRTNIVLKEDTSVELGNPAMGSCSFVLFTQHSSLIRDGLVTVIGPGIEESAGQSLPFAQIILIGASELDVEQVIELEQAQLMLEGLDGYMLRGASRQVWSRVSKEAARQGFSFQTLGKALMLSFRARNHLLEALEILFVTSSKEDIEQLDRIGSAAREEARDIKRARIKRWWGIDCTGVDCAACSEKPVCDVLRGAIAVKRRQRDVEGR